MNHAAARRLTRRLTAVLASTAATLTVAALPAHAGMAVSEPGLVVTLPAPTMTITIQEIFRVGFKVCVSGTSTTPGTWTTDIDGVRSDGSVIALRAPSVYGSVYSPPCLDVLENGAAAGEWTIRLTHNRGGITYTRLGGGTWDPQTHEHSWDTA